MITVVGSYNVDMTFKLSRFPIPGETVFAQEVRVGHGGKGSNQAVSASRLGGKTRFIGAVGNDVNGINAINFLKSEGVDTSCVRVKNAPTGTAYILLNGGGETMIVVNRGANYELTPEDLDACLEGDVLLTQLEIREDAVKRALLTFPGLRILNPAPAELNDVEILNHVDILTPNEVEFKEISNSDDMLYGAGILLKRVKQAIVVTLGENGAMIFTKNKSVRIPTIKVDPVDTTGAGDVFNASLAVFLEKGYDLETAVEKANIIASISVTTYGALGPKIEEIEKKYPEVSLR
ncbi:Nucleoside kinase [Metallosphaera sp. J1]|uniref:ribokinase n=1 Tax=Metallosphaera javensis (ex Hofmann et al. 2022) TaxID=99938 RepID=UPI001EDF0CB6|nr:ribokinase [Metallosphaera javensis (ex Hofmann et al. 2022)]MCG3109377.1 Nucleoside kinase [Metallosphaera javensis (ex Hofmann et al. 2022)]